MSLTTKHPDYNLMEPEVKKVRDCVKGSFFVKREGYRYLPHPSDVDTTSDAALHRYVSYRNAAEFDEVAGFTMRSMLGRMSLQKSQVTLPPQLEYLKQNVDNDGLSLLGQAESVAANILQLKWHVLLAEYVNSPQQGERLTPEQLRERNARPAIKSYPRDSVLDWDFRVINGVNQLSYLKLMERKYQLQYATGSRDEFDEYLILFLDESGNYNWYKETSNGDRTEPSVVYVGGKPLRWLPVEVVADIEPESGMMPRELGFLSPIVDKCLARYVDSARYAEARAMILPTVNTSGWQGNDWEDFKTMNQREYVSTGGPSVNNLPRDVKMEILSPDAKLDHFVKYRDLNASDIRALGGEFSGDETAGKSDTQSSNESMDKAAKMLSIVHNIEQGYRRMIAYCGMFAGIYSQDNIESVLPTIEISLNREFAKSIVNYEAVRVLAVDLKMSGLFSNETILKMLNKAGLEFDVSEVLDALDAGQ